MPLPRRPATALLGLALAASVLTAAPRAAHAVSVPAQFVVENAVPGAGFNTPTDLALLPDGRWLVAEKGGTVWVVQNGTKLATPFWSRPSEVLNNGDRGLLGVCVDRNFATNRYVYFLYTVDPDSNGSDTNDDAFGRLTRYQASTSNPNVVDPATRTVLIGHNWRSGIPSGSPSHTIGTVRQGSDGTLLISSGDGAQFTNPADDGGADPGLFGPEKTDPYEDIGSFRAQYIGSLAGKILRIDPLTGLGLPSNPFYQAGSPGSNQSRVWCYGLRNPFRFTFRPGTGSTDPAAGQPGTLYIGDVGWANWEELNIAALPQRNFGWPCYEGFGTLYEYTSLSPAHDGCSTMGTRPVLTPPTIAYPHATSQGTSTPPGILGNTAIGGAFYTASTYPQQYRGQYFFADYGQSWMRVATVDGNNTIVGVASFGTGMDGPVDLETDPVTGDILYVAINTNEVRRIRWTGPVDGNRAPVATAQGSPTSGLAPLTVTFTGSATDLDGDPLSYSWNFGDNTSSSQQNPVHQYVGGGVYPAILTVSDGRGGVGKDTVTVTVTPNTVGFPSTPVLDAFNRANGTIGSPWVDPVYNNASLRIDNNALVQLCCVYGAPVWGAQSFGPDQEAYIRIPVLTPGAPEHDLMLKMQGPSYASSHLEVRYDDARKGVYVATYDPGAGWIDRGTAIPASFGSGDQLGARAYANGTVEVYRNGILIGTRSVASWAYAGAGGYIGLTLDGATASRMDDFGGGNVAFNTNTRPTAVIDAPANGTFYHSGQAIALAGHGTDTQDPASALTTGWRVNLLHNTHVHPGVFIASGDTATYMGEDHDDGTGVYEVVEYHVTDTGGLSDTARVNIYPEVDLTPSGLAYSPLSPTTVSTLTVSFTLTNNGRMPAPITRWRLRAGNTVLAERDTLVPALSSVQVTAIVPPGLSAGSYALRVTADTLAKAVETDENNNAQTVTLSIGSGPNRPPRAIASAVPQNGPTPLAVNFSGSGSDDPDGDPLSYTWAFGDGGTGSGITTTRTYSTVGGYTAILTVSDGRGGSDTASVPIVVTAGPLPYPATAVLDNFNRANGPVGAPWTGNTNGFIVASNAATQNCCYVSAVWNGSAFGADQEAYFTFTQISSQAREQDLMLKVQGTAYTAGHIEVRYDPSPGRVQVATYANGKWTNRGNAVSVTFAVGDRFGARAFANGNVEVYRNNTLLMTRSVTAWPFYAQGGRIGVTLENAANSRVDNFGGGTIPYGGPALVARVVSTGNEVASTPNGEDGEPYDKPYAVASLSVPERLALSQPYPSPTDARSRMELSLPYAAQVEVAVFDVQGRRVWNASRGYEAGRWTLEWDGRDLNGSPAPRGIYLARVNVSGAPAFVRRIAVMP